MISSTQMTDARKWREKKIQDLRNQIQLNQRMILVLGEEIRDMKKRTDQDLYYLFGAYSAVELALEGFDRPLQREIDSGPEVRVRKTHRRKAA